MLDVEKKLGRRLAGRTTKAASLHRIAEYLVSRKLFEAAPEQETIVITGKPKVSARFRNAVIAGSMLLLLGAGAGAYYYTRTMQGQGVEQPLPAQRVAPLVTRPLTTPTPTTTVTPLPSGMPTVTVPPVSSPAITTKPTQTSPPASVGQKQTQTTADRKKTAAPKKKKKKTLPAN
jgi:hypothetical protein